MAIQTCKMGRMILVPCSTANGLDLAERWFGLSSKDLEGSVGKFVRGKNKGRLRGWVVYTKCDVGGWNYGLQGVIRPGMIFAAFLEAYEDISKFYSEPFSRLQPLMRRVDTAYGHDPNMPQEAPTAIPATLQPIFTSETIREIAKKMVESSNIETAKTYFKQQRDAMPEGSPIREAYADMYRVVCEVEIEIF